LFPININTKYLYVFSSFKEDNSTVVNSISSIINYDKQIKSLHGDFDSAFVNNTLITYLTDYHIRYYFTPNVYTNSNRVIIESHAQYVICSTI
jgi:hypothetical protein